MEIRSSHHHRCRRSRTARARARAHVSDTRAAGAGALFRADDRRRTHSFLSDAAVAGWDSPAAQQPTKRRRLATNSTLDPRYSTVFRRECGESCLFAVCVSENFPPLLRATLRATRLAAGSWLRGGWTREQAARRRYHRRRWGGRCMDAVMHCPSNAAGACRWTRGCVSAGSHRGSPHLVGADRGVRPSCARPRLAPGVHDWGARPQVNRPRIIVLPCALVLVLVRALALSAAGSCPLSLRRRTLLHCNCCPPPLAPPIPPLAALRTHPPPPPHPSHPQSHTPSSSSSSSLHRKSAQTPSARHCPDKLLPAPRRILAQRNSGGQASQEL